MLEIFSDHGTLGLLADSDTRSHLTAQISLTMGNRGAAF